MLSVEGGTHLHLWHTFLMPKLVRRQLVCCVSIQYSGWNTHHENSASHSYVVGYVPLPGVGEQCTVRSEGLHSPGPVIGRTGSGDPSG